VTIILVAAALGISATCSPGRPNDTVGSNNRFE
jgi:hypothetical protein